MPEQPWYVEFFGEDYLRLYRPHLTPERTERETIGIIQRLALPPGSKILDLCCGHGRISIPLAALGYRVTGLDLSPIFLAHARAAARDAGVRVRWIRSDMRSIPYENEFAAVINIFTAFGYLEHEGEDQKVLQAVARALAPGGVFLLEIAHRDAVVRHLFPSDVDHHEDGLLAIQEQEFDLLNSRLHVRVTMVEAEGARKEYRYSMRLYTLTELYHMLAVAGLRLEAYFGGLDGNDLTLDSRRLAVLARKPL
jgi:SAM-dependent methyltransferase